MAFALSSKILLALLPCFIAKHDDITFSEAKSRLINQYQLHKAEQDLGAKSTSFEISENGFLRYRKIEPDNKSEYYSAKLAQLKDVFYLGDEKVGWLVLKFTDEAVIYQTYNDKSGDVDEMLTEIKFPLKNMALEEINELYKAVETLKNLNQ